MNLQNLNGKCVSRVRQKAGAAVTACEARVLGERGYVIGSRVRQNAGGP